MKGEVREPGVFWKGRITHALDDALGGPDRRRVIVLLGSILGLQAADTGAVGALAEPLEHTFHIGDTDIGLLVTVTTLVGCVATLPFGTISDRYSRTRLLQIVVGLWSVATIVSAMSVSFPMLLITRLVLGGVIAAAGPALASLFGDLVPGDERSRLWAFVLTGELIGAGIGILVAGGLSGPAGWRVAMGILGLPAAVLAWAIRRWLPEPARGGQAYLRVGEGDGPDAASAAGGEGLGRASLVERAAEAAGVEPEKSLVITASAEMSLWDATRYVLRIRSNVALILASGLGYFFLAGLETFAELYFRERYGVGQEMATVLFLVVALGAVVGVVSSGKVTDGLIRRGRITARMVVGTVAYLATAVTFIPGVLSDTLALSMSIFFVAAFCVGAANPPVDAARLDIVPSRLWGRAEAVRTALRQTLQGLAPLLFGLVSESFGGGGAGLSTGINTRDAALSAASSHGLRMAFILLTLPLVLGGAALWLCRAAYLRETVSARRSDENLVASP